MDIDATAHNRPPNYELIKNLATECRMPLCYGGGVKSVEQVGKIISLGVEKVAMSAATVENLGVGEVVINSIDQDGVMKGYDKALNRAVHESISIPITALGCAGSLKDVADLIESFGIIGSAAGNLFVFKGVYHAILVNYPNRVEKDRIVARSVQ